MASPVGLVMKATLVVAFAPKVPDPGLKVSQGCVDVADQLRFDPDGPVFPTTTGWLEVAVEPCAAENCKFVEVVTERMAGFATVTVTALEVATLLFASVVDATRVWLPSLVVSVFQEIW